MAQHAFQGMAHILSGHGAPCPNVMRVEAMK